MVNNSLDDLMDISEDMIKYSIQQIMERNIEDIENLNKLDILSYDESLYKPHC